MERRHTRIAFILFLTAFTIGVLPVIPVGEVLAPEHAGAQLASVSIADPVPSVAVSPLIDASTIEKLRLLFSR